MGNKQAPRSLKLNNFRMPCVDIYQSKITYKSQQQLQWDNMHIKSGNLLTDNILPASKFQFKTFSLKTRKQISYQSESVYKKPSLTVLTYNIWFQSHNAQNRANALIQIIKNSNADLICLQQVTQQFMQILWSNANYLTENGEWYLPQVPMHWYDTMILSRFPMRFFQIPFKQSAMARKLLMGVCEITNRDQQKMTFSINCVHLESLNNTKIRSDQLKQISSQNQKIDIVCLVGDLNFDDNWPQDKIIQDQYIDIWKSHHLDSDQKWTMPKTSKFNQWRPDHILIKNNKMHKHQFKKLKSRIQRVGLFTIPPYQNQPLQKILQDGIVRTPSDHIGLLASLKF